MELVKKEEIQTFIDACDKMIESKYIMVDKRVADVLKSIAENKAVYNLIASCMINFNFDKAFKNGTMGQEFMLPEDPKDLVAFVFCLLNCLDDKKININDLLMRYFSRNTEISAYSKFNNDVILPFRNAVYFLLVGEKREEVKQEQNAVEIVNYDAEINNRILFLVKDLKEFVNGMKKIKGSNLSRSEMLTVLTSFIVEIEHSNMRCYKAHLLGVKAGAGSCKELLKRIKNIDDLLVDTLVD